MIKYLLLGLLFGCVFRGSAQNTPDSLFRWDTTRIDLGDLEISRETMRKDIYFTNLARVPLIIQSCITSDGGSYADYSRDPVMPGKRGKVTFVKDISQEGTFHKTFSLITNLGMHPVVTVRGNVVFPPTGFFYKVSPGIPLNIGYGRTDSLQVIFSSQQPKPFKVVLLWDCYPETDLLSYNESGNENWYRKDTGQVIFSLRLLNNYGQVGSFTRYIPFRVNNRDTVYVPVQLNYTGSPQDTMLIQQTGRYGSARSYFRNGCLYCREEYSLAGTLQSRAWIRKGAVEKVELNLNYPNRYIRTERYVNGRRITAD